MHIYISAYCIHTLSGCERKYMPVNASDSIPRLAAPVKDAGKTFVFFPSARKAPNAAPAVPAEAVFQRMRFSNPSVTTAFGGEEEGEEAISNRSCLHHHCVVFYK
mmetsp:Transcript_5970/g.11653  ORF Transcript_5970/g.11653 Transcript_5970/m.11653 type:complete len:105 (+) Transcript_5970:92-406(+)